MCCDKYVFINMSIQCILFPTRHPHLYHHKYTHNLHQKDQYKIQFHPPLIDSCNFERRKKFVVIDTSNEIGVDLVGLIADKDYGDVGIVECDVAVNLATDDMFANF